IAVILFFAKDWVRIISAWFTKPKTPDGKLFWFIVVATIPGAIAGVLLDKYMGNFSPLLTGVLLIAMGIVLYACDKLGKSDIDLKNMGLGRSILVGVAQVLAIIPGVSRSGITMSVGRAAGVDRTSIAKFTFLMSTPLILGDALYHAKDLPGLDIPVIPFIVAIVTAAVVGMLAIKFLLDFLKKTGFLVFTIYRFAFGTLVILLALFR
ncbi:MAG: undecaprenyl-diphosphate phosphatase, partial [Eubacteriales bacterium]